MNVTNVTYEIVVPAAVAAASGFDDVDAFSAGVETSLEAAAETFVDDIQNVTEAIAAAAPGDQEAAEAVDLADQATAITTTSVDVSQTLAPTPQPTPGPTGGPTAEPSSEPSALEPA